MQLPISVRENMVDDIDEYLEAVSKSPDPEAVVQYVIELLETYADDEGLEDVVATLEEESALDDSLATTLEEEMASNDEFEFTGEEIVSLLEDLCDLEWETEEDDEAEEEDEELDEEDELEEL